jgi:cell division protein FtsI (penicillin-binding protein 3)
MNFKNELLSRVYLVMLIVVLAALLILGQLVKIGLIERDKWIKMGDKFSFSLEPVDAERGNILTESGATLATSLPFYELRMDAGCPSLTNEIFSKKLDSLCYCLWKFVDPTISQKSWKQKIVMARHDKNRYLLLKDDIGYDLFEKVKTFPIFNLGRNTGGLIGIRKSKREFPYGNLGRRTIGYSMQTVQPVGIEGAFNNFLRGEQGMRLMQKIPGGNKIPAEDFDRIAPINGKDVVITLDESIQDIAHDELSNALIHHNAEYGCAVVMEVKTGKIRAMVNLEKSNGGYVEALNYALGGSVEPGSTFKAASVLALLEDGYLDNITDTIKLFKGRKKYGDKEMKDAHDHNIDSTDLKHAFAISSNTGISNLVNTYYGNNQAGKFINRLKQFRLNEKTGLEIPGEVTPTLKEAYSSKDLWSGTTLPWMSIGYELAITPLQLLTFYNAIANDGTMMKPYLVSEIRDYNKDYVVKSFEPQILKKHIASRKSIRLMKELLEAVVDVGGTAANLAPKDYKIAGKTGTSQMNYQKINNATNFGYRSSFVGYFPADNPMYSMIVVVSEPKQNGYYGAYVAGPVFRNISDRIFSRMYDRHIAFNETKLDPEVALKNKPNLVSAGYQSDLSYLLDKLDLPFDHDVKGEWAKTSKENDQIKLTDKKLDSNKIPNVIGMGLRDATYLLESMGLKVEAVGCGKVKRQSIAPGTLVTRQIVRLFLG